MKTTSQKNTQGLLADTALHTGTASVARQDTRLPIDSEARKTNRTLPTSKVLELLQQAAPAAFDLAEVVGKWVWVQFKATPAAELHQQLSQLGFHWNRDRQAWQHPCGSFSLRGSGDPHDMYPSYYPTDHRTA